MLCVDYIMLSTVKLVYNKLLLGDQPNLFVIRYNRGDLCPKEEIWDQLDFFAITNSSFEQRF